MASVYFAQDLAYNDTPVAGDPTALYRDFLGTWMLIPDSCRYEQGEPPHSGSYHIEERDGHLHFRMQWVDAEGKSEAVEFSGRPDGISVPFPGGELADALAISAVSARELNSSAFLRGRELMVAQRQLDERGQAMRVTQIVRLPDGTSPANVSIYRRAN